MTENKSYTTIWFIGHYVYCVVQNGISVILRDYMDFLRRASKKFEEMREIYHIFGAYLDKCTWEDTQSLRYPVSLSSLERRSLGCPIAMCCKQ
jgi:hypothetical protein